MKHISIIGTVGVPACYGGFETLVENLLDYTPSNVQYTVFCTSLKYKAQLKNYKGAHLIYLPFNANGKDSIFYDYKSMKLALNSDIMLILGVSGGLFLPFIRRRFKGKIITNIDGIEWKRDKWNFITKFFLRYSELQAVRYSDIVIGDNKGITDYVKQVYNKDAVLIPYGGDSVSKVFDDELYTKYSYCRKDYIVTVCRIEPENNIHKILAAFAVLKDYQIIIIGNWDDSAYGLSLKRQYSKYSNIHLLDSIYDNHELNWIRSNAMIYMHGHSAGGTNPSLVEAMNLGLPILAFDCIYNRETTFNKCLYWKETQDIISLIANRCFDFVNIAGHMRHIGQSEYRWKIIADKYAKLY